MSGRTPPRVSASPTGPASPTPATPSTAGHAASGNVETAARPRRGHIEGLRERWRKTRTILQAPRVRIEVYGDDEVRAVFRAFTARHRRFRFTLAKRWGVALLRLPASQEEYLVSSSRLARRKRARALAAGFRYAAVAPMEHIDEILEVNRSSPSRQGRPMDSVYVTRDEVLAKIGTRPVIHGIFDTNGRLRAYADVLDIGDAFTFSYLIGHADDLDAGIMYLLVGEVVRSCIEARRQDGSPAWLMVDTFWGASPGLAYFKDRTGFRPWTVEWVWVERGK